MQPGRLRFALKVLSPRRLLRRADCIYCCMYHKVGTECQKCKKVGSGLAGIRVVGLTDKKNGGVAIR